jgi:hypothetical protein
MTTDSASLPVLTPAPPVPEERYGSLAQVDAQIRAKNFEGAAQSAEYGLETAVGTERLALLRKVSFIYMRLKAWESAERNAEVGITEATSQEMRCHFRLVALLAKKQQGRWYPLIQSAKEGIPQARLFPEKKEKFLCLKALAHLHLSEPSAALACVEKGLESAVSPQIRAMLNVRKSQALIRLRRWQDAKAAAEAGLDTKYEPLRVALEALRDRARAEKHRRDTPAEAAAGAAAPPEKRQRKR